MLKTHYKSLLALALVPTLFAAQLTGLASGGSTPAAHAATTLSVSLSATTYSPGSGVTVTVNGVQGNAVTVAINAPNPANAGTHYNAANSTILNGDNVQPTGGWVAPTAAALNNVTTLPNALERTVATTNGGGTVAVASFSLPTTTVNGTYSVYAIDAAGDTGSASFVVSSNTNTLLVNSGAGTTTLPLGGKVSVYFTNSAAKNLPVSFSLATFGYGDILSTATTTPANAQASTALSSLGTGTATIPLRVVSSTPASAQVGNTVTADANGTVQATLQLSTPALHTPALISSLFFDQVYSIIATTPGAATTGSGSLSPVSAHSYTLTEGTAGTTYNLVTTGTHAGTSPTLIAPVANAAAIVTALSSVAIGAPAIPAADVSVTGGAGTYTITLLDSDATALSVPGALGGVTPTVATAASTTYTLTPGLATTFTLAVSGHAGTAGPFTGGTSTGVAIQTALRNLAGAPDATVTGAGAGPFTIVLAGNDAAHTLTLALTSTATTVAGAAPVYTLVEGTAGTTYTLSTTGHSAFTTGLLTAVAPADAAAAGTRATAIETALTTAGVTNVVVAPVIGVLGTYTVTFSGADIADGLGVANVLTTSTLANSVYSLTEGTATTTYTLSTAGNTTFTTPSITSAGPGVVAPATQAAAIKTALTTGAGSVLGANVAVAAGGSNGTYTITFANTDIGDTVTVGTIGVAGTIVSAPTAVTAYQVNTGTTTGSINLSVFNAATSTTTSGAILAPATTANLNTFLTGAGFTAGQYALVGTSPAITVEFFGLSSASTLSSTTLSAGAPGVVAYAGIKLDRTLSTLTPYSGSNLVAPGATSVAVSGSGWGANSTVFFYYEPLYTAFATVSVGGNGPEYVSTSDVATIPAGSATAGDDGTFSNATATIPALSASTSGVILAEDVAPASVGESGYRLNAAAFLSFAVSSSASTSGGLQVATNTPAIGQTVAYTGTGFAPSSTSVTFSLGSGTTTTGGSIVLPPQVNATVDATGAAHGTFVLPTGILLAPGSTVTATLSGLTAAGTSQTLTATLTIPSLSVTAIGSPTSTAVTFTGTGFWSGESVVLQYIAPGTTTPVALGTVIIAGLDGKISGTVTPSTTLANGSYTLTAQGVSSGFIASGILGIGGYLSVPTTVIPGQTVVISGTQFAATPSGATASTLSVNFVPTPVTAVPISVDATGALTATFVVPTTTVSGTYTLTANAYVPNTTVLQQRYATIKVVTAGAPVFTGTLPTSAAVGGTVPISLTGFLPNETVNIALQYTTNGLAGTTVPGTSEPFTADANGVVNASYIVKSTAGALVPGAYNLVATGASSGLKVSTPFTVAGGTNTAVTSNVYFAEGFTGTTAGGSSANFTESISILNANNFTTTYTVTYFLENKGAASSTKAVTGTIGADSVVERAVNTDAGANASVAAEVSSPAPLASSRIIARSTASGAALDSSSSLGQQLDLAATGPFSYYFASGDVMPTNEQYLTVLNPNSTAANVTVTILPQAAVSSTSVATVAPISITVPAMSRVTEPIRKDLLGKGLTKFGVSLSSNVPVAAERVEYYGDGTGSAKYGATTKPASSSAQRQYVFAADSGTFPSTGGNSAIGTGSDISEVDVINPAPSTDTSGSATVTVSFFDKTGKAINSQQVQVDAGTRETISVNDVAGTQGDVFSTVVTSDKNVFAERPTFYGGDPTKGGTFAAITPTGAPAGLTSVAFPYLDLATSSGAAISQTVFLYNPGGATITVRGIFAAGTQTVVKTYTVPAGGITAVAVNADASTLTGAIGGIFQIVTSTAGASDSFVALAIANTAGYKVVTGDQGTYPVAASTGF